MGKFHESPNLYIRDVVLKVSDLKRSVEFYKDILGLSVLNKTERKVELTADGKTSLVTLEQPENVVKKSGRTAGLYHFAILLPDRKSLSRFLHHLLKNNVPFGASDHHVSEAIYLNDPDGNGIEVYRDRPEEEWVWKNGLVHMVTDPLDGAGILAETDEAWTKLPRETIMGHIHLHVSNLKEAEEFYSKRLGYDIVSYYPQAAFLSTGRYHHHLAINTWQGTGVPPTPENSTGLRYYSVVFPDERTRMETVKRLKGMGAEVAEHGADYMAKDPAGNQILFVL